MTDTILKWIQETPLNFNYEKIGNKLVLTMDRIKAQSLEKSYYWFPCGIENSFNSNIFNNEKFSIRKINYNDGKQSVCLTQLVDFYTTLPNIDTINESFVFVDTQGNILIVDKENIYVKSSITYTVRNEEKTNEYISNDKNLFPNNDSVTEAEREQCKIIRDNSNLLKFEKSGLNVTGVIYDLEKNKLSYYNNGILSNEYLSFPILSITKNRDGETSVFNEVFTPFNKIGYIVYVAFLLPESIISIPGLNETTESVVQNTYSYIYKTQNSDDETYLDIISPVICKESSYIKIYTEDGYLLDANDYLPKFLKDSDIMTGIMDLYNHLLVSGELVFGEIREAYEDMMYKIKDYSRLSMGAKLEIIHELGFDYLLDIIPLTDEQLTKLITFFNLIYMLKGKREGLDLCLGLLNIPYTYVVWDETSPRGARFTAKLTIVGNEYSNASTFGKLKDFVRAYMLPWIDVIIEVTSNVVSLYLIPVWGAILRYVDVTRNYEAAGKLNYLRVKEIDSTESETKVKPDDIHEGVEQGLFRVDNLQQLLLGDFRS